MKKKIILFITIVSITISFPSSFASNNPDLEYAQTILDQLKRYVSSGEHDSTLFVSEELLEYAKKFDLGFYEAEAYKMRGLTYYFSVGQY